MSGIVTLSGNNLLKEMGCYNTGKCKGDEATLKLCLFIAENIEKIPGRSIHGSQRDLAIEFKKRFQDKISEKANHIKYFVEIHFSLYNEYVLWGPSPVLNGFTRLNLADLTEFGDEDLIKLVKTSPNLKELDLSYTKVTDMGLQELVKGCPYVEKLILTGTDVGDKGIMAVAKTCHDLIEIDLTFTQVSDESLKMIGQCSSKLRNIKIANTKATDIGVKALDEGLFLEVIILNSVNVGDRGVVAVAKKCRHITELDIARTNATNESLKAISEGHPCLKKLDISHCKEMTDEGLKWLEKGCLLIEELVCAATKITNAGLMDLAAKCTHLKRIRRDNHEITKEFREEFRSTYPNIEIFTW